MNDETLAMQLAKAIHMAIAVDEKSIIHTHKMTNSFTVGKKGDPDAMLTLLLQDPEAFYDSKESSIEALCTLTSDPQIRLILQNGPDGIAIKFPLRNPDTLTYREINEMAESIVNSLEAAIRYLSHQQCKCDCNEAGHEIEA